MKLCFCSLIFSRTVSSIFLSTIQKASGSEISGGFMSAPDGSGGSQDYSYGHNTNRGANAYGMDNRGYAPQEYPGQTSSPVQRGGMVSESLSGQVNFCL